jgi:hypothetical protein
MQCIASFFCDRMNISGNIPLKIFISCLQRRQVYIFRQPEEQSYRGQLVLSSQNCDRNKYTSQAFFTKI